MWLQTEFIFALMAAPVLGTVVAGALAMLVFAMSFSKSK